MVGEIRDAETAQIAINSALTGHLVFTTVHANNVLDVLGRFLNMGVEAYQFVSALNCVLAQRLVRTICAHCRRPAKVSRALLEESGLDPGARARPTSFYEGLGCIECGGTGYKGRTAICELLDLSDRIREMILDKRPTSEIKKAAREEGMRFLRESAVERVMQRHDDAARNQQGDVRRMSLLASLREHVGAGRRGRARAATACRRRSIETRGGLPVVSAHASEPLPAGALAPSLTRGNVKDRAALVGALGRVLDRARRPPQRRVALVVPDRVAKVSLVRFEQRAGAARRISTQLDPVAGAQDARRSRSRRRRSATCPACQSPTTARNSSSSWPGATRSRSTRACALKRRVARRDSSTSPRSTSSTPCWRRARRRRVAGRLAARERRPRLRVDRDRARRPG